MAGERARHTRSGSSRERRASWATARVPGFGGRGYSAFFFARLWLAPAPGMSWRRCRKGLVRDDRVSSRLWPIRLGGRIRWWWPPLAAWGAAAGVVTLTCTLEGWRPFAASRTWVRWDSGLYLSVAEHGYHLFRCRSLVYGRGNWCGNAGWFPAYPWLVRGLHLLDVPFAQAGLAISWLAGAVMLVVVWRGFGRRRTLGQAAVVVGYAAFAPGLVYDFALFPLSLLSLCAVTAFALADRGRWLPAGLTRRGGGARLPPRRRRHPGSRDLVAHAAVGAASRAHPPPRSLGWPAAGGAGSFRSRPAARDGPLGRVSACAASSTASTLEDHVGACKFAAAGTIVQLCG